MQEGREEGHVDGQAHAGRDESRTDAFRALVVPYLRAFPTSHPSLREAGAHLAAFLDSPLLSDLARLERARVEAFDGADAKPLAREHVAALSPDQFGALRLELVPTATIVELSTNADEIWDALGTDAPCLPRSTRRAACWSGGASSSSYTARSTPTKYSCRRSPTWCKRAGDVQRALALLVRWLDARCMRMNIVGST